MTTRCVVVPPSPINPEQDNEEFNVDNNNNNNNSNNNQVPLSPLIDQQDSFSAQKYQQQQQDSSITSSSDTYYTRNRSTTRSWPVIYRNNSLLNQQQHQQQNNNNNSNFLEPSQAQGTKTEQLQSRSEQQKRKSTHQYDFDQIFGLNNANYQQYLASHRKSSNFDTTGYDKSPSIYDMQQHHSQDNPEQTQTGGYCNTPPTIIFLLVTLIMTTSATSMLCAAFLTGKCLHNIVVHLK